MSDATIWQDVLVYLGVGGGGAGAMALFKRLPVVIRALRGLPPERDQGEAINYTNAQELIHHEHLLEELWRLGVPAVLLSADNRTILANEALGRLLDYGPAALASQAFTEFAVNDANFDEDQRQWARLISGQQDSYELPLRSWRSARGERVSGKLVVALVRGATWGAQRLPVVLVMIHDRTAEINELSRRVAAESAMVSMQTTMSQITPRLIPVDLASDGAASASANAGDLKPDNKE